MLPSLVAFFPLLTKFLPVWLFWFSDRCSKNTWWGHSDSVLGAYKHATRVSIIITCWLSKCSKIKREVVACIHPHQSGCATSWENSLCPQLVYNLSTFGATKLWNRNTYTEAYIGVNTFGAFTCYYWRDGNTYSCDLILQIGQCNCWYLKAPETPQSCVFYSSTAVPVQVNKCVPFDCSCITFSFCGI